MVNWSHFCRSSFLLRCFGFDLHHNIIIVVIFWSKMKCWYRNTILVWLKYDAVVEAFIFQYCTDRITSFLHLMNKKIKAKRLLHRSFTISDIWIIMKRATIYLEQINFICWFPYTWALVSLYTVYCSYCLRKKDRVEYPPAMWNGAKIFRVSWTKIISKLKISFMEALSVSLLCASLLNENFQ